MARKKEHESLDQPETLANTNGGVDTLAPETAETVAAAAVAVKRHKSPRETFYLVLGESRDGTATDVLGRYETGHQARKALDTMRMAVARSYGRAIVVQCRDRTNV